MRISDWSSDVCSSDLVHVTRPRAEVQPLQHRGRRDDRIDAPECLLARHDRQSLQAHIADCNILRSSPTLRQSALFDMCRRSEEHTSELQSLMRISYAVFCLKQKKQKLKRNHNTYIRMKITKTHK